MIKINPKQYKIQRSEVADLKNFLQSTKCELGSFAEAFTAGKDFNIKNNSETLNFRLVSFDKDLLLPEILEEIDKAGFKLPEAQDTVWFAIQYPEVQLENPVAFLHKPWIHPNGGQSVLILRNYSGNRYLHMHLFDTRWYSHIRFAVVEK